MRIVKSVHVELVWVQPDRLFLVSSACGFDIIFPLTFFQLPILFHTIPTLIRLLISAHRQTLVFKPKWTVHRARGSRRVPLKIRSQIQDLSTNYLILCHFWHNINICPSQNRNRRYTSIRNREKPLNFFARFFNGRFIFSTQNNEPANQEIEADDRISFASDVPDELIQVRPSPTRSGPRFVGNFY